MRIIGGRLGGRRFYPPAKGWPTRPTTDVAKEALYNILHGRIDFSSAKFLDLFGGTGSHSFEMISRGCTDVTYVDSYRQCCEFVRKTAKELEITDALKIVCQDAFRFCAQQSDTYDYIFAGPPYGLKHLDTIPSVIISSGMLTEDGILVLEHNPEHDFSASAHFTEVRNYGETHFSFFRYGHRKQE
jgi:16S rRNA (guanine(966)-N(2))-methyltransferase RsmD